MMKLVKLSLVAAVVSLGLSACGGDAGQWKDKYQKLIDEACACKDQGCMDKVSEKRRDLKKEFREKYKDDKENGKKIGKELSPMDDKWSDCRKKVRDAAGGGEGEAAGGEGAAGGAN